MPSAMRTPCRAIPRTIRWLGGGVATSEPALRHSHVRNVYVDRGSVQSVPRSMLKWSLSSRGVVVVPHRHRAQGAEEDAGLKRIERVRAELLSEEKPGVVVAGTVARPNEARGPTREDRRLVQVPRHRSGFLGGGRRALWCFDWRPGRGSPWASSYVGLLPRQSSRAPPELPRASARRASDEPAGSSVPQADAASEGCPRDPQGRQAAGLRACEQGDDRRLQGRHALVRPRADDDSGHAASAPHGSSAS